MTRHQKEVRRQAKTTVLIVGEGDTEKAFLDHLKSLYVSRGCGVSVTIRNAHGKGPDHVLDMATRYARGAGYSIVAVLMDTDLPWRDELRKFARMSKVCMVGASPCCDGLLLQTLGENVPATSSKCKAHLLERLGKKPLEMGAFSRDFSRELIDRRRGEIGSLDKLLNLMTGVCPTSD